MDTERLCWEARVGFGRAPPQDVAGEQRMSWELEEELEGEEESGEEAVEEPQEEDDEEEKEEEEDERASDTLLQELDRDCGETRKKISVIEEKQSEKTEKKGESNTEMRLTEN